MNNKFQFSESSPFKLLRLVGQIFFMSYIIILIGCSDMNVESPLGEQNETLAVLQSTDLNTLNQQALIDLFRPHGTFYSSNVNLEWAADYITMTNNVNQWWSLFKREPRVEFINSSINQSAGVFQIPFQRWNSSILKANVVINGIRSGELFLPNFAQTEAALATAHFTKAMAYGYLANTFDRAIFLGSDTAISLTRPFSNYSEIILQSMAHFDTAMTICARTSFTLPSTYLPTQGGAYTNQRLSRLAATYKANFMVQNARTAAENSATNWAEVLRLTGLGLQSSDDFTLTLDGVNWDNGIQGIAGLDWYWRVDHRVIRWIDPNYPKRFPNTIPQMPSLAPASGSADGRLATYFKYETGLNFFNSARGPQLRSHYRFARFENLWNLPYPQPSTYLYAETNRLLRAEALAMTGDVTGAIAILNSPTGRRKTQGNVADIPQNASLNAVLNEIHKERDLELMFSDFGLHFKDMRRKDLLQAGTLLHLPVPFQELQSRGMGSYTYGGLLPKNKFSVTGTALDTNKAWIRPSEQNLNPTLLPQ